VNREQQSFVGHILPQRLAINLERAPRVRAPVLGSELLQLLLKLLLSPPPHHRLGVRDAPREAGVRQLCVKFIRHTLIMFAILHFLFLLLLLELLLLPLGELPLEA